ncbi:MAG: hypothetical protein U9O94_06025 [Nanoarchaeota archaeon]|nr:hypothetical protein [Nanoarchaeota archaeon]
MKIIREKESKKVLYLLQDTDEVILTDKGMSKPLRAFDIRIATHEVIEDIASPDIWIGGGTLSYDTDWGISNQTMYDEFMQDRLDKAKQSKLSTVSNLAKTELDKGLVRTDGTFSISESSISSMRNLDASSATPTWYSNDYVKHTFTPDEFDNLIIDCVMKHESIIKNKLSLKGEITQATTIEILNAIDLNGGW